MKRVILLLSCVILFLGIAFFHTSLFGNGSFQQPSDLSLSIAYASAGCSADLDNDGFINEGDLSLMIQVLLQGNTSGLCADLNGDEEENIVDLQALINRILNPQSGDVYYVSPTGNDSNAGTKESPWRTLQTSMGKLDGGDTLFVEAGTYNGVELNNYGKDSEEERITLRNVPGSRPMISNSKFRLTSSQYVTISGFEFDGVQIEIQQSHHIIIENNLVHHARYGIYLSGEAHDCTVRHNEVYGSELGSSQRAGEVGIVVEGSTHNLIEYNISYNMFLDYKNGDGIGLFYGGGYNVVSHNIMHDNPDDGLDGYSDNYPPEGYNIVEYNTIYRSGYGENGQITDGNGVGMKTNYEQHHWIVRYNISYNNTYGGISDEDSAGNSIFYNNTTYNNLGYGFGAANSHHNYIFANNASCGDADSGNNPLLSPSKGNLLGNIGVASTWFQDAANGDFHPRDGSPLIDGGISQIVADWITIDLSDYQGNAPDTGAFEYGAPWDIGRQPGLFDIQTISNLESTFTDMPTKEEIREEYDRLYALLN